MKTSFVRAKPEDKAAAEALVRDTAYAAAYAGEQSVQTMREGTDALVSRAGIRRQLEGISVTACTWGGVPCELLARTGSDSRRRVMYLHGGAFVRGNLALGRANASLLAHCLDVPVLAVGYRQAPEHPYPAAPDDVRRVFEALQAHGLRAEDIIVTGESSGGCLALGLAADLTHRGGHLPRAIGALSPMVDLEMRGVSWDYNADRDLASRAMGRRAIDLYVGTRDRRSPVASPVAFHFQGCCPLFLGVGSHETMLSDTEHVAYKAADIGVDVELVVYEGMPHGFTRFESAIGTRAIADLARWVDAHWV